jgi:hypothetical protein
VRDRSEASVTRGEREQRRGPRSTRSRKLGLLLGLALLASLVLGVTLASAIAPTVTVEDATQVEYTTAMVEGNVDPQGEPTTYGFQYIAEAQFQENLTNGLPGFEGAATGIEGSTETVGPVSGELVGLQPGTTFHLRLLAENGDGPSEAVAGATFVTKAVAKPVVTIAAPSAVTGTSAHFEGTIDPGGTDPAFNVFWRFRCEPECPGLASNGVIPADNSTHVVSVDAEGLQPNTAYEVFLIAENAGGATEEGPVTTSTALIGPAVTTTAAFTLSGGTAAQLGGLVNPENSTTTYYFEYGTDASYGSRVPAGEAEASLSAEPVAVSQTATGLSPETAYHYRVIAKNAAGTVPGEDKTFVTPAAGEASAPETCPNATIRARQHATGLPDCRAWEMVSPVDKNGNDIQLGSTGPAVLTPPEGNAATFVSLGAFAGAEGSTNPQWYLARRGPTGWTTRGLSPRTNSGFNQEAAISGFSEDLSLGFLSSANSTLAPGALEGARNVYLRDNLNNTYSLVGPGSPGSGTTVVAPMALMAAATPDFSTLVFESEDQLTPDATPGVSNVYEYSDGRLTLASILPGEVPATGGAYAGNGVGFVVGRYGFSKSETTLSRDGSRVVFTDASTGQIYLREDGTRTVHVSASQRGTPDPEGPQPASWLGSSADGSQIFFKSAEKLTNDSHAAITTSRITLEDLYRYDLATGKLTDLTAGSGPGGTEGVVGVSEDGSYVYFVANAVLAKGAQPGDCANGIGSCNLYMWHTGTITLIGRVDGNDLRAWEPSHVAGPSTSSVAADGKTMVITSEDQLTGYDNGGHDELYRYDAASAELSCLSCDRSGRLAQGDSGLDMTNGNITLETPKEIEVVTDGGNRIFFSSEEGLAPQDGNGKLDVYEWEQKGTGTCVTAGGCTSLISSGQSSDASGLGNATPDGGNLFFSTRQPLVGIDVDHNSDLYDAREDGGIAAQNSPAEAVSCTGEACRGVTASPPAAQAPASSTYAGPVSSPHHKKKRHKKKHHHKQKNKKHKNSGQKKKHTTNRKQG